MKLLHSLLLCSLAAASEKAGRGLNGAGTATDLLDRWDMAVPDIIYEEDDDKFTFTLIDASAENYNHGLAESFWNPDCMPAQSGDNGHPLNDELIRRADGTAGLPFYTMQDVQGVVGKRPKMEFKIDPAEFAKSNIPNVYSGTEPSCDTPDVQYSLLLKGMECPTADRIFSKTSSEENCYKECKANALCTQFSFYDDSCIGCSGTAASLVPSTAIAFNTYETCDIRTEIVDVDASKDPSLDFCTATSTAVNYGTSIGSCGNDATGLFAESDVETVEDCHEFCSRNQDCGRFSYWRDYKLCLGCSASADMTSDPIPFTPAAQVDFGDTIDIINSNVEELTADISTDNYGVTALRTSCGKQAYLPINISPSVRPDVTVVVGAKLEQKEADKNGWIVGQDNGSWDRGILFYDDRGASAYKGIGMANGPDKHNVWNDDTTGQPVANQWTHIAAVWSQNGNAVEGFGGLYVDGEFAPKQIVTNNNDGLQRLVIGAAGYQMDTCDHRMDGWIKEVKVYDGILSTESVKALSDTFFASLPLDHSITTPTPTSTLNYDTYVMCPPSTPNPSANSRIDFCIRSSLGYTLSGGSTGEASLDSNPTTGTTEDSNYQEVNFIETLVRIEYDMSSGFEVASFSVAPKNRELTTISESYEDALTAYLCDTSPGKVDFYDFDSDESYPKARPGTADPFNQGALITVCVRVKEEFASQNIVLKELTDFSWTRSGGSTFNRAIGGVGDDLDTITQVAITGSEAAGNYLTSYNKDDCSNAYWCNFASVLFAQFYNTPGSVSGTGDAILQFRETRNRRLGGVDERSLQGDPGSAGMDISIDVNGVAEGPGDLKTASGPSFGATTVSVSVVTALIGAVLLA